MNFQTLQDNGVSVNVTHLRKFKDCEELLTRRQAKQRKVTEVLSKGGTTIVRLSCGNKQYFGRSVCSSSDNFSRKIGREIALERALIGVLKNA